MFVSEQLFLVSIVMCQRSGVNCKIFEIIFKNQTSSNMVTKVHIFIIYCTSIDGEIKHTYTTHYSSIGIQIY